MSCCFPEVPSRLDTPPRGAHLYRVTAMAPKPTDPATWLAETAEKVRANDPEWAAVLADEAAIERTRERRRALRQKLRDVRLPN